MALADLVVVMNSGKIEQAGTAARGLQQAGLRLRRQVHRRPQRAAGRGRARGNGRGRRSSPSAPTASPCRPARAPTSTPPRSRASRARSSISARPCRSASTWPASKRCRPCVLGGALRRVAGARPASRWFCRGSPRTCTSSGVEGQAAPRRRELKEEDEMARKSNARRHRPPQDAQGRGRRRRRGRRQRRDHRLPDDLGAEQQEHRAAPVRHRRVGDQRDRREVQGRSRHHAADDGARFRRRRAARGDAAELVRHRRHRILDDQEGLPGQHAAGDGRQEDQAVRQDRADLHHRQAEARQRHRPGHGAAAR